MLKYENGAGNIKQPTIPHAKEWSGWKTPALKPAFEPIIVAQKPCKNSITENVMKYGVGGFNIDECRIIYESEKDKPKGGFGGNETRIIGKPLEHQEYKGCLECNEKGRYPSNLLMQEECFGKLSKYFIISKASSGEKEQGCEEFEEKAHMQFGSYPQE